MILRRLLLTPDGVEAGALPVSLAPALQSTTPTAPTVKGFSAAKPSIPTDEQKKVTFSLNDPAVSDLKDDTKEVAKEIKKSGEDLLTNSSAVPEKKVSTTAVPEKKPEVSAETKYEHKQETTPIVPKKKVAQGTEPEKEFDYKGFSESEASALRQMSTGARDFTIKLLRENKELSVMKTAQFMQHPDAYVLTPEFKKLQEDVYYVNQEAAYWQNQLSNIKAGEPWKPITGWDKDGKVVLGAERKPTAADEEQVRLMMNRCITLAESKNGELTNFTTTFKNQVTNDSTAIQQERAKRFGWVGNPEILKETVVIESGEEKSVGDIRNTLISLFPGYMRNTLAVEVAADLFAAIQIYGQELREMKQQKQVVETQVREVSRAEPTSRRQANSPGRQVNGISEFSLSGMPS